MIQFEGKVILRIKPVARNGIIDRSFMHDAIKLQKVMPSHAYYTNKGSSKLCILPADYCDDGWEEVFPDYAKQFEDK
jgi:hypothetical protein